MTDKNMTRAYYTKDESGIAVFERGNDVIVVPVDAANLLLRHVTDESWEELREILNADY